MYSTVYYSSLTLYLFLFKSIVELYLISKVGQMSTGNGGNIQLVSISADDHDVAVAMA